ncbi:MAG: hypothetical protein CMF42_05155 [Legionellales bacterium]|nr:hypothetical protein [Legionellales bacterium]OUX67069.1 MAG: hypothetical protein CBD38_03500 [bacterium TMED178]
MSAQSNTVYILSGEWKGRKITFPSLPGLRPGTGVMRECLMSWIRFDIKNATILDAFTGSGILGLDALSEGAAHVDAIDQSKLVIRHLSESAHFLPPGCLNLFQGSFPTNIPTEITNKAYDFIFLDPPYDSDLLAQSLQYLEDSSMLNASSKVFIHYPKGKITLSSAWKTLKTSHRRHHIFSLIQLHKIK